jgi:hypothetical protein
MTMRQPLHQYTLDVPQRPSDRPPLLHRCISSPSPSTLMSSATPLPTLSRGLSLSHSNFYLLLRSRDKCFSPIQYIFSGSKLPFPIPKVCNGALMFFRCSSGMQLLCVLPSYDERTSRCYGKQRRELWRKEIHTTCNMKRTIRNVACIVMCVGTVDIALVAPPSLMPEEAGRGL